MIHPENIRQIYTYVKNQQAREQKTVSGMLLYAGTDEEVYPEQRYRMSGNWIEVRTLDLDGEFSEIRRQLDGIAERYFGER